MVSCRVTRKGLLWGNGNNITFEYSEDALVYENDSWPQSCSCFDSLPGSCTVTALDLWCLLNHYPLRDSSMTSELWLEKQGLTWLDSDCRVDVKRKRTIAYDPQTSKVNFSPVSIRKIAAPVHPLVRCLSELEIEMCSLTPQTLTMLYIQDVLQGTVDPQRKLLTLLNEDCVTPYDDCIREKNCVASAIAASGLVLTSAMKQLNQYTAVPWTVMADCAAALDKLGFNLILVNVHKRNYTSFGQMSRPGFHLLIFYQEGHALCASLVHSFKLSKLVSLYDPLSFVVLAAQRPLASQVAKKKDPAVRQQKIEKEVAELKQRINGKSAKVAGEPQNHLLDILIARLNKLESQNKTNDKIVNSEINRFRKAMRNLGVEIDEAGNYVIPPTFASTNFGATNFAAAEEAVRRNMSINGIEEEIGIIASVLESNLNVLMPPRFGNGSLVQRLEGSALITAPETADNKVSFYGVCPIWDSHRGMWWFVGSVSDAGLLDYDSLTLAGVAAPTLDMDEYTRAVAPLVVRADCSFTTQTTNNVVSYLNIVVSGCVNELPGIAIRTGKAVNASEPGHAFGVVVSQKGNITAFTADMSRNSIYRPNTVNALAPKVSAASNSANVILNNITQSVANKTEQYSTFTNDVVAENPTLFQQGFNCDDDATTVPYTQVMLDNQDHFWRLTDTGSNLLSMIRYGHFKFNWLLWLSGVEYTGMTIDGLALMMLVTYFTGETETIAIETQFPSNTSRALYYSGVLDSSVISVTNSIVPIKDIQLYFTKSGNITLASSCILQGSFSFEWNEIPGDGKYMNFTADGVNKAQQLAVEYTVQAELFPQFGTNRSVMTTNQSPDYYPRSDRKMTVAIRQLTLGATKEELKTGELYASSGWKWFSNLAKDVVKPFVAPLQPAWTHVAKPLLQSVIRDVGEDQIKREVAKQANKVTSKALNVLKTANFESAPGTPQVPFRTMLFPEAEASGPESQVADSSMEVSDGELSECDEERVLFDVEVAREYIQAHNLVPKYRAAFESIFELTGGSTEKDILTVFRIRQFKTIRDAVEGDEVFKCGAFSDKPESLIWFPAVGETTNVGIAVPVITTNYDTKVRPPAFTTDITRTRMGVPKKTPPFEGRSCELAFLMQALRCVGFPVRMQGFSGTVDLFSYDPERKTCIFVLGAITEVDRKILCPGLCTLATALGVVRSQNGKCDNAHAPCTSDFFTRILGSFSAEVVQSNVPMWKISISLF